jgi:hypothetical protein
LQFSHVSFSEFSPAFFILCPLVFTTLRKRIFYNLECLNGLEIYIAQCKYGFVKSCKSQSTCASEYQNLTLTRVTNGAVLVLFLKENFVALAHNNRQNYS